MKKSLIILGSIIVIGCLMWLGLVYWIGSGLVIGGGGSQQYVPDTVETGESTNITLIVTATGGGKIQGRFKNISLFYRLVSENTYKSILPQPITLPDNFKTVQSKTFQSEAYQFTIPPYPKGTTGEIEYYIEMTFDGYQSRQEGVKKIKIINSVLDYTTTPSVSFQGHILKGQSFQKDIGKGLIFKLTPDSNGWNMDIFSNNAQQYDYGFASIVTPPFHGITALQIEGWHFRNKKNTAQNDGSVNAPQITRDFSFALNKQDANTMVDAINLFTSGKKLDFNPNVYSLGKGELVIQNLKLGNLVSGSQAWIESMDFNVSITLPKTTQ